MTTGQPERQHRDASTVPDDNRTLHRWLSVLIALALVPPLGLLLIASALSGPERFFGEYSSEGGRHAIVLACLALLASASWAWFFAGYRRAAPAGSVGFLIVAASAVVAACLIVEESKAMSAGPAWRGRDEPDTIDVWLVGLAVGLSVVAVMTGCALRHPRLRLVGLVVAGLWGAMGACFMVLKLVNGGYPLSILACMASPMVLGLTTFSSLWFGGSKTDALDFRCRKAPS